MMQDAGDPAPVELAPPGEHRFSLIWLHGLGADGHDFMPLVRELGLPAAHGIRFIFPHAPHRPVTINGELPMRAWYDIASAYLAANEDGAGIRASIETARGLIAREVEQGIDPAHVILAGFSQGGAVALAAGLRHDARLGGIAALSAYLPLASELADELAPANRETPIFQAHGSEDAIVAPGLARSARDRIAALRPAAEWHEYAMAHAVCAPEIHDLRHWLTQAVGAA